MHRVPMAPSLSQALLWQAARHVTQENFAKMEWWVSARLTRIPHLDRMMSLTVDACLAFTECLVNAPRVTQATTVQEAATGWPAQHTVSRLQAPLPLHNATVTGDTTASTIPNALYAPRVHGAGRESRPAARRIPGLRRSPVSRPTVSALQVIRGRMADPARRVPRAATRPPVARPRARPVLQEPALRPWAPRPTLLVRSAIVASSTRIQDRLRALPVTQVHMLAPMVC